MLYFKDHIQLIVGCKYSLIDNQAIRCIKLENAINKRSVFEKKNVVY